MDRSSPDTQRTGLHSRPALILRWFCVVVVSVHNATVEAAETRELPKTFVTPSASGQTVATNNPWRRIVMVGASVSAGFTESEPFGGPNTPQYRLSRYVDAAISVPHQPVRNLGSSILFLQPEELGRQQIEQAIQVQPTLVIGLDFLFWFCYGDGRTDAERLRRFEQGLKLVEAVRCPLILGDIPDASAAANGMLRPDQIPSAQAMAAANRRLKEWAARRKQVVIVSLSNFMRLATANQSLTIRDHTWREGTTRAFLQNDQLHPSARGCVAITLAALDGLMASGSGAVASDVRWDPEEVLRRGSASIQKPAKPPPPAVPNGK